MSSKLNFDSLQKNEIKSKHFFIIPTDAHTIIKSQEC